jgi:hypothetical protein
VTAAASPSSAALEKKGVFSKATRLSSGPNFVFFHSWLQEGRKVFLTRGVADDGGPAILFPQG